MVKALWVATKYAVPHMEKTGNGSIVNIASVHGLLMAEHALDLRNGQGGCHRSQPPDGV